MKSTIIIGSRGSDLALWQAEHVAERLKKGGRDAAIRVIRTKGDEVQDLGFDKMEGKGFFTKEIEQALLTGDVDVAVHSYKDLETTDTPGLSVAAVSEREDPSELLLMRPEASDPSMLWSLKRGAIVGTSSARRKNQLLLFRPDVKAEDLRGNVPTRIQKLRDGRYDAILIAKAGVNRLAPDLSGLHAVTLDPGEFIPAPAQGVLACQVRSSDRDVASAVAALNDSAAAAVTVVERTVMRLAEGGCRMPLGVYCRPENGRYRLWASLSERPECLPKRICIEGKDAKAMGEIAIRKLTERKPETVLVTRELAAGSLLRRLLEANGYTVHGMSFIRFEQVAFGKAPATDWIFFSSKNSVRFFLGQKPVISGAKLAAVGSATAAAIRAYGHDVAFTGEGNDTVEIARVFRQVAGGGRVLFPQSDISLRTVQQELDAGQAVDLVAYRTIPVNAKAPRADVIVFTSPSNTSAYLTSNIQHLTSNIFIAMGKTTGKMLEKWGITDYTLPWSSNEIALADAILSNRANGS